MSPRVLRLGGSTLEVLESCSYTFVFDTDRHRFRRVPRGTRIDPLAPGEWQPYEKVTLDADTGVFRVVLNRAGTRLMSAGWHGKDCPCETPVAASGAAG